MRWFTRAFKGGHGAPRTVDEAMRASLLAVLEGDLGSAEQQLTAAARIDSRCTEAYLALARLYRMRGEIGRAIRIHQNLLLRPELGPAQRLSALADLAADFRQGGFLQRAIAAYQEVLTRAPRHQEALVALVRLHADARDFERALAIERRLARLEGRRDGVREAKLWVELARAAQADGRCDAARRAAKRAIRTHRECVSGWCLLGELEAQRGRMRAAVAAWRRVPRLDRASGALVYPQLEAGYAALGRPVDYQALLRALIEDAPDDATARLALGRALAARGETDAAVAELRAALDHSPDDLEARSTLGRVLIAAHRDPEAIKEYGELIELLDRRASLLPSEALE